MWAYLVKSMKHSIYKAWFYRPLTFLEELRRIKAVTFIADYSGTRFVQTRIPQNGVFLEHTVFPLHNSSLFIFVEQTRRVNTDSSNCSPLFTNKNPQFMRNKTFWESRSKFNVCFTLTSWSSYIIQSNHRLNAVNNLQSRPAIKTVNSCIDNPLNKQPCFFFYYYWNTAYWNTSYFPTEFEESALDCTRSSYHILPTKSLWPYLSLLFL